ncbi:sigma-70 family RNA polymerase sigma factor [Balneolales bacterium ANBcel1]|nr:sigma-70 family RNA polymerase sigma factor [Balneolales bacterium ANBcel1]
MDYKKFIETIQSGSTRELSHLYDEIFKVLCGYLRTHMRANNLDAEECAQHALTKTFERIQKNAIREPENLYSYLLQSAKNRYLRILKENKRNNYQDNMEYYVSSEEPLDFLSSDQEQRALDVCLEKLPDESRAFMEYWLEHPDAQAADVAAAFGISVNNVWIRKHRIIKKLSECIQKKIQE